MKSKEISEEIKILEKRLEDMRASHRTSWDIYGSELCAGDMLRQEDILEQQILKLKKEENILDGSFPYYLEDPSHIVDD